jgi:hypothetical protein
MGVATLNGVQFRLDPTSISWPYRIVTETTSTIGGKVVQVLGASLGDLTVTGSFGTGGWREEKDYLDRLSAIAEAQTNATFGVPVRFTYAPRRYDFQVYIKQISPIRLTNGNFNPTWNLTLFIVEDTFKIINSVKNDAMDSFIQRIADGIGWKQSEYNGPLSAADAAKILSAAGASTIKDYLEGNFRAGLGYSRTATGGTTADSSANGAPGAGTSSGGPTTGSKLDYANAVKAVAQAMRLPRQACLIAFMTCLVESGFQNYANSNIPESLAIPHDKVGSDNKSVGIFQQQSGTFGTFWGTVSQCMDPKYAASRFFQELVKNPNYATGDPGAEAQRVQVSNYPERYNTKKDEAEALLQQVGY